jgi:RNA polymerase sigma factor (sigma-70 family)
MMMHANDTALLQRWATRRDAEAFNELVTRHAAMVYATCRRILRNEADAEDVSQECFLRLAQRPHDVRTSLGGWLHRVATTRSLDRIRKDARRTERERKYQETAPDAAAMGWDDVQEYIDAAIDALPGDQRRLIIDHFLERKTHAEIAEETGSARRTVSRHIQIGVEAIRETLAQQRVTLGAAALTSLLTANAAEATPASLSASLGKMALTQAKGQAVGHTGVWTGVLAKTVVVGALALGILGVLVVTRTISTPDTPVQTPKSLAAVVPEEEPTVEAPEDLNVPTEPDALTEPESTGTPVVEVATAASADPEPLPRGFAFIEEEEDYAKLSGTVLDEEGYGIVGATVSVYYDTNDTTFLHDKRLLYSTRSEKDGRYAVVVPIEGTYDVLGSALNRADGFAYNGKRIQVKAGTKHTELDIILKQGVTLWAEVFGKDGRPVTDAAVELTAYASEQWSRWGSDRRTRTDAEGRFTMGFEDECVAAVKVNSPTHGERVFADVPAQRNGDVVVLRFEAHATLKGQVKTASGKPVAKAHVRMTGRIPMGRSSNEAVGLNTSVTTDENGSYEGAVVPGEAIEMYVQLPNTSITIPQDEKLEPLTSGEVRVHDIEVIDPEDIPILRGRVVSASSGEPLAGRFDVRAKSEKGDVSDSVSEGEPYELRFPYGPGTYKVWAKYDVSAHRSDAPDYSEMVELEAGEEKELDLVIEEPVTALARVVDAAGVAVDDVQRGLLVDRSLGRGGIGKPLGDGRFEVTGIPPGVLFNLYAIKSGYIKAKGDEHENIAPGTVVPEETLVLYQVAGVEGHLMDPGGQPIAGAEVKVAARFGNGKELSVDATTDLDGHVTLLDVLPATRVALTFKASVKDDEGTKRAYTYEFNVVTLTAKTLYGLGVCVMEEEK